MFHPHPNFVNENAWPDDATLKKLMFADTIEALKNAPGPNQPLIDKTYIATLVKDVVSS